MMGMKKPKTGKAGKAKTQINIIAGGGGKLPMGPPGGMPPRGSMPPGAGAPPMGGMPPGGMKRGGKAKKMARGGGVEVKGKTKGKTV